MHLGHFHPLSAAGILGALAVTTLGGFNPADIVILGIAAAGGLASYRTRKTDIVRRSNEDLADRNSFLEGENKRLDEALKKEQAEIVKLEARPTVDTLALAIEALIARLESHDTSMTRIATEQIHVLQQIALAVTPPPHSMD